MNNIEGLDINSNNDQLSETNQDKIECNKVNEEVWEVLPGNSRQEAMIRMAAKSLIEEEQCQYLYVVDRDFDRDLPTRLVTNNYDTLCKLQETILEMDRDPKSEFYGCCQELVIDN